MDLLWFFLSCVCYDFVRVCLFVPCSHLLGKGWPLASRLWCLTKSLLLSHGYPGSGVVLDCIDFWSFHHYLLYFIQPYALKSMTTNFCGSAHLMTGLNTLTGVFIFWLGAFTGQHCDKTILSNKLYNFLRVWFWHSTFICEGVDFQSSLHARSNRKHYPALLRWTRSESYYTFILCV